MINMQPNKYRLKISRYLRWIILSEYSNYPFFQILKDSKEEKWFLYRLKIIEKIRRIICTKL